MKSQKTIKTWRLKDILFSALISLCVTALVILGTSCKKKTTEPDPEPIVIAPKYGSATINILQRCGTKDSTAVNVDVKLYPTFDDFIKDKPSLIKNTGTFGYVHFDNLGIGKLYVKAFGNIKLGNCNKTNIIAGGSNQNVYENANTVCTFTLQ